MSPKHLMKDRLAEGFQAVEGAAAQAAQRVRLIQDRRYPLLLLQSGERDNEFLRLRDAKIGYVRRLARTLSQALLRRIPCNPTIQVPWEYSGFVRPEEADKASGNCRPFKFGHPCRFSNKIPTVCRGNDNIAGSRISIFALRKPFWDRPDIRKIKISLHVLCAQARNTARRPDRKNVFRFERHASDELCDFAQRNVARRRDDVHASISSSRSSPSAISASMARSSRMISAGGAWSTASRATSL